MIARTRPATTADIPAIASLLLKDAAVRETLNGGLWSVASDALARVHASLRTISEPIVGPVRHHWLVVEQSGEVFAVAHGVNMPPPPIVDLDGGTAGVILDDSHLAEDGELSALLLQAVEQVMRQAGALLFVGASPAGWTERTAVFAGAGYEKTTLYMAKTGLDANELRPIVRRATAGDIPAMVRLNARHRVQLMKLNSAFWNPHADAEARFAGWMTMSLVMPDRSMFVSGSADAIDGFIVAQPGSSLHLAPAHDAARTGLIDDFCALAFEPDDERAGDIEQDAGALLGAAEGAFHDRGIDTVLAICPAKMSIKEETLRSQGYVTANLWMVKTDRP